MIVFQCVNIKIFWRDLTEFCLSKMNPIYNPIFFFLNFFVEKGRNCFPGKNINKKTAKQFTVFMKKSAVLCSVVI